MKMLLFGANGQVGWELRRSLLPLGELKACDRSAADLEDLDNLRAIVREIAPTIIVNAAAYTAVDNAESEPEKASRINAEAVELMANEAKRIDAWLVHYSTDYVFDGTKPEAYVETDEANPLSVYGKTKYQGEEAVRKSSCKHLIFRTSWVYASRGNNFAKTILRLASEREQLKVVADQVGAPTSAELIADVTAQALYQIIEDSTKTEQVGGTYHLTAAGETSWHGYAQYVLATAIERGHKLKVQPEQIEPIATAEYPTPAKRPANSRLDTTKLCQTFGVATPPWEVQVERAVAEIVGGEQ